MVACSERHYRAVTGDSLEGRTALVFGGTGPVGMTCAMLAAQAGARAVIVSHEGAARAKQVADDCNSRYGTGLESADGSSDAAIEALISDADVVFSAAKAGVQVLGERHLAKATRARVLCDVNAVPPSGIAGVGVVDDGVEVAATPMAALGIGALAVGNIKYRTQQGLLKQMLTTDEPVYLHYPQAFDMARTLV
jgi:methylene-tetrahydromethanopterin dehydrogenase